MDRIGFGTGGLRGVIGDESGEINCKVIQWVTHGLAKVILSSDAPKSVGVAYDTRHNSTEFAQVTCDTLSAFGIEVYIFDKPIPTPILSFAIRHMKLGWGVCITASHNPKEYNGYKVYDKHGVQVTDRLAAEITDSINLVEADESVPPAHKELIKNVDREVVDAYQEQIVSYVQKEEPSITVRAGARPLHPKSNKVCSNPYSLVYSALHGTGANAVSIVLERLGFSPIYTQQNPDGAFGGLETPNPEEPAVYEKALAKAKENGAKLILATDPDCDRVGVMVKTENGFELLNGNQIGALLIDYLAQTRGVSKGDTVISTIVSGVLGELVAKEHGLEFVRLLTGFKYIGEYIVDLPEDKHFFFGYEESYGYLAGDGAKDKDAVIASALIVKMAAFYDNKRKTLLDRWHELSEKHGYCLESLHSINVLQEEQKVIMSRLRDGLSINGITRTEDYLHGFYGLPKSDVLKLHFNDNNSSPNTEAWAAIRPSGTEPKLKLYTGVHAKTYDEAKTSLELLTKMLIKKLEA
jgi:phosphoglucomutase